MIRKLLMLIVGIGALVSSSDAQTENRSGTVIFAAYTDTNLDGAIFTDVDAVNLFALNLASGQITLLGSRPSQPILPVFSPNRQQLAFIDRAGQIIVSRLDGSPQVLANGGGTSLAWLDDRRLVYRTDSLFLAYISGQQIQLTPPNLERDLIQVNAQGTRALFTQTIIDTNFSGAVGLPGDTNRLYAFDFTNGEIRIVAQGVFRVETPRFAPDGNYIAYVQVADSNRDAQYTEVDARSLWLIDAAGNPVLRLSPEASVGAEGIVWNAIGTHILFVHQPDLDLNGIRTTADPLQIGMVSVTGGGFNVLAQPVEITQLVSSPEGVFFAYVATVDDSDGNGFMTPEDAESLHVVNINDDSPIRISPPGVLVTGAIAFAPGSPQIAYVAATQDANGDGGLTVEDATTLFIASLSSAPAEELVAEFSRVGQIAWNTAGDQLIASVENGTLLLIDPDTGAAEALLDAGYQVDLSYPLMWMP